MRVRGRMVDIDYIMELLDWNNSSEDQLRGIELARNVKCTSAVNDTGWENRLRETMSE